MLPVIEHPLISIDTPSKGVTRQYRRYLTKEQKILLIAKETNDLGEMMNAIQQIVTNCSVKPTENLATFDIEYIFIKLHAASVSNIITQIYEDNTDGSQHKFEINLDDVKVVYPEGHSNKIQITSDVGLIMKYPSINKKMYVEANKVDQLTLMIKECLDQVWQGEEMYNFKDSSPEEVDTFLDSLPPTFYDQFTKFLATMPHLYYEMNYTNKEGKDVKIVLRTLQDFFTLV